MILIGAVQFDLGHVGAPALRPILSCESSQDRTGQYLQGRGAGPLPPLAPCPNPQGLRQAALLLLCSAWAPDCCQG